MAGTRQAWSYPDDGEHTLIGSTLRAFRIGYAPPFWDHLARHLVQTGISPNVAEQAGPRCAKAKQAAVTTIGFGID